MQTMGSNVGLMMHGIVRYSTRTPIMICGAARLGAG